MLQDSIHPKGWLEIILTDEFGNEKLRLPANNLVVETGKQLFARRMSGVTTGTSAAISHMTVGSSNTTVVAGDVALGAMIPSSTVALDTIAATTHVIAMTATFGPGVGTGQISEAGLFNAASSGVMVCRTVFTTFEKFAPDTLTINWNLSVL